MKRLLLLLILTISSFPLLAQEEEAAPAPPPLNVHQKMINIGATIGFNTTFPIINSIRIDDVELENIRLTYRVGHLASVFFRLNMDRFFIQPSLSLQYFEGDIHFSIPENLQEASNVNAVVQDARLEMTKKSLQVPVHIGYHIVREGPYGLSFMAGPTLKYNYDVAYKSLSADAVQTFLSESNPFGMNIALGVSVQVWQLFFDFSYEFGLNQTESDFRSRQEDVSLTNNVRINKRTNVMSFSLGIIF